MANFYNYNEWLHSKVVNVIYEHHLMDEIYNIYHTTDSTDKFVRGRLGHEIKVYRVWRTSNGEWLYKKTEYEQ